MAGTLFHWRRRTGNDFCKKIFKSSRLVFEMRSRSAVWTPTSSQPLSPFPSTWDVGVWGGPPFAPSSTRGTWVGRVENLGNGSVLGVSDSQASCGDEEQNEHYFAREGFANFSKHPIHQQNLHLSWSNKRCFRMLLSQPMRLLYRKWDEIAEKTNKLFLYLNILQYYLFCNCSL